MALSSFFKLRINCSLLFLFDQGMFKMKKNSCQMNMTPQQACDEVFDKLDQNNDQKLSKMEFIVGAKASPMMLLLLQTQTSE